MTEPRYEIYYDHLAEDEADRFRICEVLPCLRAGSWGEAEAMLAKIKGERRDQAA